MYNMQLLNCYEGRVFVEAFCRLCTELGHFDHNEDSPASIAVQIEALKVRHFTVKEQYVRTDFLNIEIMSVNKLTLLHAQNDLLCRLPMARSMAS
jgi:hypothetical protein